MEFYPKIRAPTEERDTPTTKRELGVLVGRIASDTEEMGKAQLMSLVYKLEPLYGICHAHVHTSI